MAKIANEKKTITGKKKTKPRKNEEDEHAEKKETKEDGETRKRWNIGRKMKRNNIFTGKEVRNVREVKHITNQLLTSKNSAFVSAIVRSKE